MYFVLSKNIVLGVIRVIRKCKLLFLNDNMVIHGVIIRVIMG